MLEKPVETSSSSTGKDMAALLEKVGGEIASSGTSSPAASRGKKQEIDVSITASCLGAGEWS